jgi:hypothetical protein
LTSGRNTPTSPQTNRLNGAGTAYDAAGNLTNWNSAVYQYDDFNQMIRIRARDLWRSGHDPSNTQFFERSVPPQVYTLGAGAIHHQPQRR